MFDRHERQYLDRENAAYDRVRELESQLVKVTAERDEAVNWVRLLLDNGYLESPLAEAFLRRIGAGK